MLYIYPIVPARAAPGTKPVNQEPIVGRWYCGVDLTNGDGEAFDEPYFGDPGRYEGEGVFVDEDGEGGFQEIRLGGYDYLQEQL